MIHEESINANKIVEFPLKKKVQLYLATTPKHF